MKNHLDYLIICLIILMLNFLKSIIIEMNKILKRGTSDEDNPRYNGRLLKILPNKIGLINVIDTSSPKEVDNDMVFC